MKKTLEMLSGMLMLMVMVAGAAYAGNSQNIMVSCSIPGVPGINMPLLQQNSVRVEPAQSALPETKAYAAAEETKPKAMALLQQTEEKKIELAKGQSAAVTIETLYVR